MIHCPDERARPAIHRRQSFTWRLHRLPQAFQEHLGTITSAAIGRGNRGSVIFLGKIWRRRPDLNRGWRFCRLGKETYVVDSSCFLVGPYPPRFPCCLGATVPKLFPSF